MQKKETEKPTSWEVKDPKPPVIRSGHMENRVRNGKDGIPSMLNDEF